MTSTRDRAAAWAGLRLALALGGTLVVLVAAVPLAVLLRADHPGLVAADRALSGAAVEAVRGSEPLLHVTQGTTLLGDPMLLTLAAALLALQLWRRGHSRLALFVVVARLGAVVLSQGLKAAIDRARPVFDEPVATALGASFPSGHALGSAAFYATTAVVLAPYVRRSRLLLLVAVVISGLVAASRVLLGVHFLSDVTSGFFIGLGWATLCTAVFAVWRREEGRPVDVTTEGIGR